jgi:carbonic anhydrase/acetyltransferase-like protein (isoleucine patch superfamily)
LHFQPRTIHPRDRSYNLGFNCFKQAIMKYALGELKVIAKGEHWIAPNASVIGNVIMENNTSVWFNAVIRGDNEHITLGENSQVQDGAVLHADPGFPCTLGKNVSIGHLAMVHGCTIGDGTLVGIKSVILNGAVIGKNCLIGANSLIGEGKVIPDGSLVIGSPGRVARQLTEEEIARINGTAANYVTRFKRYKAQLAKQD